MLDFLDVVARIAIRRQSIDKLIDQETREGPVFEAGWKPSTLRLLFEIQILKSFHHVGFSDPIHKHLHCPDCGMRQWFSTIRVLFQTYWLAMLEAVKGGTHPRDWLEKEMRNNESATMREPDPSNLERMGLSFEKSEGQDAEGVVKVQLMTEPRTCMDSYSK